MGVFRFFARSVSTGAAVVVLLLGSVACADHSSPGTCWDFDGPANTSVEKLWDFGEKDSPNRGGAIKWVDTEDDSHWIVGEIPENVTTGLFSFSTPFFATQLWPATGDAQIEFFFSIRFNMAPWCRPTDIWIDDIKGGFYDPDINESPFHSCTFVIEDGVNFEGKHKIEFVFDLAELLKQGEPLSSLALYIEFDKISVLEHNTETNEAPEPVGMLILGSACVFLPFRRRLRSLLS